MDSDSKHSRQFTTNWTSNWVNVYKKQKYPNGWWKWKITLIHVIFSCALSWRHNNKDARRIKTQEDFFNKIFTSHFIARFRKGCVEFYCERELETEHNWNILTPKLWPSALCLSRSPGLLNRSPGVHSAGCWLSLLHLVHLRLQLYSPVNSSALYYLQTPTRRYGHASTPPQFLPISGDRDVSLPLSLEWPVWSSSSGNNCHVVQRSLSSGASVYESIMEFHFTSSHFSSQFPPTRFPLITATRMCHFLPVHHLEWHFWPG